MTVGDIEKEFGRELTAKFFGRGEEPDGYIFRQRKSLMAELHRRLSDEQNPFTLIVGSGVTASVNLPIWSKLLGRLEINAFDLPNDDSSYCPAFHTAEEFCAAKDHFNIPDPLELAEYIKLSFPGLSHEKEAEKHGLMKTVVRKALEANTAYLDISGNIDSYLCRTVQLIEKRFQKNNRLIVTTNYDNLLEYYYEKCARSGNAFPVYDGGKPRFDRVNIYHIHGFLGLDGTDRAGEESERIILTEDDYRELEQYPYCWENYLLTRTLHEGDSLFLGYSGDDNDFRRILRGFSERYRSGKRYLVICIDEIIESTVKMALAENRKEIDYMLHILCRWLSIKAKYWREKGFIPIWTTWRDSECTELLKDL